MLLLNDCLCICKQKSYFKFYYNFILSLNFMIYVFIIYSILFPTIYRTFIIKAIALVCCNNWWFKPRQFLLIFSGIKWFSVSDHLLSVDHDILLHQGGDNCHRIWCILEIVILVEGQCLQSCVDQSNSLHHFIFSLVSHIQIFSVRRTKSK